MSRRPRLPFVMLLPILILAHLPSAVLAQEDHDGHDDDAHHDHLHDDAAHHRPPGTTAAGRHAGHAHPGVDLSHPIVIESPLPETKLRVNYSFADGGEGSEHVAELEAEYAFAPQFSVEAVLPYVAVDPDDGPSGHGLGDAVVAFKFASYAWADRHRVLPAIGLEVALPTGDDEEGTGSDHVVELEPFVRVGAWRGPFEFIGTVGLGVPLNQSRAESDEEDFAVAYGGSLLYRLAPAVQALVEVHGDSTFGDDGDVHALYLSPGLTCQPFPDRSVSLGLGATFPVTDDRDFDYAVNLMAILHF